MAKDGGNGKGKVFIRDDGWSLRGAESKALEECVRIFPSVYLTDLSYFSDTGERCI